MATFTPNLCGDNNLYVPDRGCTDCEKLEKRVTALEECCAEVQETLEKVDERLSNLEASVESIQTLLSNYTEITISKTDDNGDTVTAYVLGRVERTENPIQFYGLEPLTVTVGEEFDPMEGVGATGCNDTEATVTVEDSGGTEPVEKPAPTISGLTDKTITAGSSFNPMDGVSATDYNGNPLEVTVEGTVNTSRAGTYTLTYSATDDLGQTTTETRTITVRANTPTYRYQTIYLNPSSESWIAPGGTVELPAQSVDLAVGDVIIFSGSDMQPTTYTVTNINNIKISTTNYLDIEVAVVNGYSKWVYVTNKNSQAQMPLNGLQIEKRIKVS